MIVPVLSHMLVICNDAYVCIIHFLAYLSYPFIYPAFILMVITHLYTFNIFLKIQRDCLLCPQARQLMQKIDNLLDSMSRVLLKKMSSASPPVSIETPALSMKLQKSSAADVGGKAIATPHADIILPTNLGTQGSEQDISLKVQTREYS